MKICFLTKKGKPGVNEAIDFTKSISKKIDVIYGDLNDPFPDIFINNEYDILISYISPWIVPNEILKKTKKWNINFHPGPPEYPGIGCFNFALFESAKKFGATAHLMNPKVDTGEIIGVNHFPMTPYETVKTLSIKTYKAQLALYIQIMEYINSNKSLPKCDEKWKRKPYTRNELEKLAEINPRMNEHELKERIRATYYPGKPAPFLEIFGYRFEYNPDR